MASVADISCLGTKITFVVAEIIIKENVITSCLAKITFIVAEIICKVCTAQEIINIVNKNSSKTSMDYLDVSFKLIKETIAYTALPLTI